MISNSELATRSAVGVALIAAALLTLWLGGVWFWMVISAVAILMYLEWGPLVGGNPHLTRLGAFALSVPLAIMSPLAAGPDYFVAGLLLGAAFFTAAIANSRSMGAGICYAGLPALALVWLRERPDGLLLTLWALLIVWATDIGAFFAGRAFGGPRLAPRLSPNKTWSGLAGGVVSASAAAGALHFWAGLPVRFVAVSPVLATIAQGGDLFESWLKRRAGVKDSGTLLPGHGGLLDRLDGLVTAAPCAALVTLLSAAS